MTDHLTPGVSDSPDETNIRRRTVGVFLKEARESAGLTQRTVADALGYTSPQFVSNWERGEALPPMNVLLKLPKLLDLSPRRLLEVIADYQKEVLLLQKERWQQLFAQAQHGD